MKKEEFIAEIADRLELSKAEAKIVLETVFGVVADHLIEKDPVSLDKIGTLSIVETKARSARNPRTGEELKVPAGHRVKFSVSAPFRRMVKEMK